jgi:hypothetical protein
VAWRSGGTHPSEQICEGLGEDSFDRPSEEDVRSSVFQAGGQESQEPAFVRQIGPMVSARMRDHLITHESGEHDLDPQGMHLPSNGFQPHACHIFNATIDLEVHVQQVPEIAASTLRYPMKVANAGMSGDGFDEWGLIFLLIRMTIGQDVGEGMQPLGIRHQSGGHAGDGGGIEPAAEFGRNERHAIDAASDRLLQLIPKTGLCLLARYPEHAVRDARFNITVKGNRKYAAPEQVSGWEDTHMPVKGGLRIRGQAGKQDGHERMVDLGIGGRMA